MKTVYVFTKSSCLACRKIKQLLVDTEIPFNEINVLVNKKLWKEVIHQNQELDTVPAIFIRDSNNDSGFIYSSGRDFNFPEELIEILKKNI